LSSNGPISVNGQLDLKNLPTHLAIIMDGNGRWAKSRLLNRIKGHEKGADAVRTVVRTCRELGIAYLTLYAFSTENWQRPKAEINALMNLLKRYLESELTDMLENNIRLGVIGEVDRLPQNVFSTLQQVIKKTHCNTGLRLSLALSYGGRSEILRAAALLAEKAQNGDLQPAEISSRLFSEHLYTHDLPDPDLLIRTSGEMRISNFLLWQMAYAEIYITRTLWPDFTAEELKTILIDYQKRERRFGKVQHGF
jgi:undecaprenyl diphosphate synthase